MRVNMFAESFRKVTMLRRAAILVLLGLMVALITGACGSPAPVTSSAPTAAPPATVPPTSAPTAAPDPAPTAAPTSAPTSAPTAAPTSVPTSAPTAVPTVVTLDPITGAPALARGALRQRPIVVMIDNHPNAYPQSGLDKAAVVFEALAEFGLTRFMAVYAPGITPEASSIGPVRSARLYFVQWAMEFRGLYVHAGGAPQALETLRNTTSLVDVDALFQNRSVYFARIAQRSAPHNLYTDSAALERALRDLAPEPFGDPEIGFLFKPDAPPDARPPARRIEYFFIYREDPAGWTYDPATNSYLRLRRGRPAIDAVTGQQLRVKNVVVMEVPEKPIPGDDKGRIEQMVIGSGKARVFMDGVEREVTWQKGAPEDRLLFLDASGNEIAFNAGQIWIVALPSLENLTIS
jgi:hypothetical protein